MDNYTLSDLAAVTRDNDGAGTSGAWWIIILFLFVLMSGGGGFGFGARQGELGQYATAASQQDILFGQHFGRIDDRLTNIGNGICNLGYEMQGSLGQLGKEMALAQNGTNMAIMQSANGIQAQLAECCCTTQRAIDGVNANMEAKFAALEKSQLEQRIAEQSARIASLEMDNRMYGVVRYPNGYAYNAGPSPFCACGGCNGNI
nr:MAG TPA: hypothetical protein [Caudoviricetes sp.]